MAYLLIFAAGAALAAWNTWQRLGRSRAARAWTDSVMGGTKEKSVLALRPLGAIALMAGGLTPLARENGALLLPTAGTMMLALLLLLAYLLLPLPVPAWAEPRWYREGSSVGKERRAARERQKAARRERSADE